LNCFGRFGKPPRLLSPMSALVRTQVGHRAKVRKVPISDMGLPAS
jgi:hypothetical protein